MSGRGLQHEAAAGNFKNLQLENYQQFRSLLYALKLSTMTCKAACDWTAALIDRSQCPISSPLISRRREFGQTLSHLMSRARVVDLCKVTEMPPNFIQIEIKRARSATCSGSKWHQERRVFETSGSFLLSALRILSSLESLSLCSPRESQRGCFKPTKHQTLILFIKHLLIWNHQPALIQSYNTQRKVYNSNTSICDGDYNRSNL